jgi:threonine/homoserine/homoserine lactone efflux protein
MILGLMAGVSPGPLFALIIGETLQHGKWAGLKISFVPIITDGVLILVSLFFVRNVSDTILGAISLVGAFFLGYLAYESMFKRIDIKAERSAHALRKGILTNVVNPHPYVFWFAVGAPIMAKALQESAASFWLFIIGFFSLIIGTNIMITIITERSSAFLKSKGYAYTIRILGVALLIFAILFLRDAVRFLS